MLIERLCFVANAVILLLFFRLFIFFSAVYTTSNVDDRRTNVSHVQFTIPVPVYSENIFWNGFRIGVDIFLFRSF